MTNEISETPVTRLFIGDVDPVTHGGMWIEKVEDYYEVVTFDPCESEGEGLWDEFTTVRVGECSIHLDDLEDASAASSCDIGEDADPFMKVYAKVSTWGCEHLGGDYTILNSDVEVERFIEDYSLNWD